MKLPEDKKERAKILALIAVGAVGVLYMVIQVGITPLLKSKQAKIARIQELKEELKKARREIDQVPRNRKKNYEGLLRIKEVSEKYALHPRLGNFLLVVTDILEKRAEKLGIELESIREIGISEIPQNSSKGKENAFKSYGVSVALTCSFHDVICFLREIESSNPYLCIFGLGITGQPEENPEKHRVSFNVQWPIWADYEMPARIEEQLQGLQSEGTGS